MPDDDMAHFPERYWENYIYLLDIDPCHIRVFWEVIPESVCPKPDKDTSVILNLLLKINYISLKNRSKKRFESIVLPLNTQNLVNAQVIGFKEPILKCQAEIGYTQPKDNTFIPVCFSNHLAISLNGNARGKKPSPKSPLSKSKKTQINLKKGNKEGLEISDILPLEDRGGKEVPSSKKITHQPKDKKNPYTSSIHDKGHPSSSVNITEEDVISYYKNLPDKIIVQPTFTPWRSILESLSIKEREKRISLSNGENNFEIPQDQKEYCFSSDPTKP